MKNVNIIIECEESDWGPSLVEMTVPETVYGSEIFRAMEYAKCDLEEIGIPEDWSASDINVAILNLAAESLKGTWRFVGFVEFCYQYDGRYLEEEDEPNEQ